MGDRPWCQLEEDAHARPPSSQPNARLTSDQDIECNDNNEPRVVTENEISVCGKLGVFLHLYRVQSVFFTRNPFRLLNFTAQLHGRCQTVDNKSTAYGIRVNLVLFFLNPRAPMFSPVLHFRVVKTCIWFTDTRTRSECVFWPDHTVNTFPLETRV